MVVLAFYKAKKTKLDKAICFFTRSKYSHVEMIVGPLNGTSGMSISSSGRNGGVKERKINFNPERWDIVEVPWGPDDAVNVLRGELDKPYDFFGILFSQFFNARLHSKSRWFCSEICAYGLNMSEPHRYSPGDLYLAIQERNLIYNRG